MEVQIQLILTACIVNYGSISAQLQNQMVDQAVTRKLNDEIRIGENFQNLFSSIAKNNMNKSAIYRKVLMQESQRELETFDSMKEELKIVRRNAYKNSNAGRTIVALKRNADNDERNHLRAARTEFFKNQLTDNADYCSTLTIEMPVRELSDILSQALASTGTDEREIRATVRSLLDNFLNLDATDHILNPMTSLAPDAQRKLADAVSRLKKHEPVQYIIGSVHFADNLFKVTPAVLIPRPETEEWVMFLTHHVPYPTSILDIGTGSGCIAITLKQKFPQSEVDAIDVSGEALDVARHNAARIGVRVHFAELDILKEPLPQRNWSLIVSNPPYVLEREKVSMHLNVLDYEPHSALFVDDAHPLLFYERIVHLATRHLSSNGILSMEINEAFGEEVTGLLHRANFKRVSLHKDMQEKDRWVVAAFEDGGT